MVFIYGFLFDLKSDGPKMNTNAMQLSHWISSVLRILVWLEFSLKVDQGLVGSSPLSMFYS